MKGSKGNTAWFCVTNHRGVRLFVHTTTGRATPAFTAQDLPRATILLVERNGSRHSFALVTTCELRGEKIHAFMGGPPLVRKERSFRDDMLCSKVHANARGLVAGDMVRFDLSQVPTFRRRFVAFLEKLTYANAGIAARAVKARKRRTTASRAKY